MIRTCLAATVTVMSLATAWTAGQPADKPATGAWTRPVHGIQCRLSITKPSFDVDELLPATGVYHKTEVVLSIKNTSSETMLVKTTTFWIRLHVHQDGRPVAPVFEQSWPVEDQAWDPRAAVHNHHWLEPGKEIAFPVLFVGHDSNFGTPLARYWLKPGRYQVKAIFRSHIRGAQLRVFSSSCKSRPTPSTSRLPVQASPCRAGPGGARMFPSRFRPRPRSWHRCYVSCRRARPPSATSKNTTRHWMPSGPLQVR